VAVNLASAYRGLPSASIDSLLRNAIAGVICAIVSLVFSLSYATLIFSGPLVPWLAYGMAATFITAAVGGFVMASRSSLPFALASPDASTSAMTAALVGALAARLAAEGGGDRLLAPTLILLPLTAALAGLALCGLGIARAGRAVRFVPYPVIGGFLGASGWLIASGAVQVMTGHRLGLIGIERFLDASTLTKLAVGVAVAALLLICRPRFKGPLAQPIQLLACVAAVYAGLTLLGISLTEAQANGWMFQAPSPAAFAPPWHAADWRAFPWHLLPAVGADLVAVMFVAAVSILLNVAGLEVTAKREADLDRELTTVGASNLLAAAFGGYVNGVPLSRSTLAFKLGGNSRIPSLCVGASSLAMLGINPGFLAYIPK
jgi:SulP family sulfate permease